MSAASSRYARMAPPDEAASSGGESVIAGVASESPKPRKVSLSSTKDGDRQRRYTSAVLKNKSCGTSYYLAPEFFCT